MSRRFARGGHGHPHKGVLSNRLGASLPVSCRVSCLTRLLCAPRPRPPSPLPSKSLGTLHNVKHGKSGNTPVWLETGFGGRLTRLRNVLMGPKVSRAREGLSSFVRLLRVSSVRFYFYVYTAFLVRHQDVFRTMSW